MLLRLLIFCISNRGKKEKNWLISYILAPKHLINVHRITILGREGGEIEGVEGGEEGQNCNKMLD